MATGLAGNIVVAKVISMVALGCSAFLFTMAPVFIHRRLKNKEAQATSARVNHVLSFLLAFGGGVLLCTTFLHLLPEVSEDIESLQSEGRLPSSFPLALPELIMCCGFFIMYIIEEAVHKFMRMHLAKKLRQGYDNPLAVSVDETPNNAENYKEVLKQENFRVEFSPPSEEDVKIVPGTQRSYGSSEVSHVHDSHIDHDHQRARRHSHNHEHDHNHVVSDSMPSLREFLLVLALTIHEGFEGCAIGLESTVTTVWYLTAAVAVHKSVIAFCIGVEFVSGQLSTKVSLFYGGVFAVASPIGVACGLALSTSGSSSTSVASVVLQGIATGTLLYVVFFEILKKDASNRGGMAQMLAVIVGFVAMAAITGLISA